MAFAVLGMAYSAVWGTFTSALWTLFFRTVTGMARLRGRQSRRHPRHLTRRSRTAATRSASRPSRRHRPSRRRSPMPDGRLVVCATPIGNLGDVTLRVLDALRDADTVAAEDTRVTRKLLARYEISAPSSATTSTRRAPGAPATRRAHARRRGDRARLGRGHAGRQRSGRAAGRRCIDGRRRRSRCCRAPARSWRRSSRAGCPRTRSTSAASCRGRPGSGAAPRALAEPRRDARLLRVAAPRRRHARRARRGLAGPARRMARELTKLHEEVVRGAHRRAWRARSPRARSSRARSCCSSGRRVRGGSRSLDEDAVREQRRRAHGRRRSRAAAVKEVARSLRGAPQRRSTGSRTDDRRLSACDVRLSPTGTPPFAARPPS